ncbi:MAG: nucleoside phosphorylase [Cyclobacteriaceae bacterium]
MKEDLPAITENKYYTEASVFEAENLLREARRQKGIKNCPVPSVCLLDPDGDLVNYLLQNKLAEKNACWACYHSLLYTYRMNGFEIGILPCVVGASYAVLVAEQLFVSGCQLLLSVTSAGIIQTPENDKRFALISSAIRDEGTSYHYLPAEVEAILNPSLAEALHPRQQKEDCPYFFAKSWTTDAPYRETASAIEVMKEQEVSCVEMEAAALYALAMVKKYPIICFAHLTNTMAQQEGDFEKGEAFGSIETLRLTSYVLKVLSSNNQL